MSPSRNLTLAAIALTAGLALAALSATGAGASVASPTPPRIVATPNNQMVNHPIKLVGTGFNPNSTLVIKECSRTQWTVMQNPCDVNNAITVTTDSHGGFRGTIVALLCPAGTNGRDTPRPEETCYVGNPVPRGVDGMTLRGAAKITVTWP